MNQAHHSTGFLPLWRPLAAATLLAFALPAAAAGVAVMLSGAEEVPPVTTQGRGSGEISVGADGAVSGAVTVSGMNPTVAHIHDGARGQNGPVLIKLERTANGFAVPAGARLTGEQMARFKAGNTYVNVHSEAFPPGEIRGQLTPSAAGASAY